MAISFIAESHSPGYGGSYVSGVTCNKPTGTAQNDLMIWVLGGSVTGAPSGWTQVGSDIASGTDSMGSVQVYYKIAGSSEPSSYSASFTSTYWSAACSISTYRGINTSTPVGNFSFGAASGTNYNTSAVTATGSEWAYSFACDYTFQGSSHTFTEGSGTERVDAQNSTGDPATATFMCNDSNANVASGSFSRTQTCSISTSAGAKGVLLINSAAATTKSASAGSVTATASAKQPRVSPHAEAVSAAVSAKDATGLPAKSPAGGLVSCFASAPNPRVLTGFLVFPTTASASASVRGTARRVFPDAAPVAVVARGVIGFEGTPWFRTYLIPADKRTIVVSRDVRTYVMPADKPEQKRVI